MIRDIIEMYYWCDFFDANLLRDIDLAECHFEINLTVSLVRAVHGSFNEDIPGR